MDGHFASASFIEDIDLYSVAESSLSVGDEVGDVFQIWAAADNVVCDVVADVLYHAVIPYYDIMQGGVVNSAMLVDASGQGKDFPEGAEFNLPWEIGISDVFRIKFRVNEDIAPVLASARLCFQLRYLLSRQWDVGFHFSVYYFW